jgi:SagB-type dehydrogenase family enzyme
MDLQLPPPTTTGSVTVEEAIACRRSCRFFTEDQPLSFAQLSQILWAAQGITGDNGERAAPSAGGQYPLYILAATGAVAGTDQALHCYRPHSHSLTLVAAGDHRSAFEHAALDHQPWIGQAALVLAVVAEMPGIVENFRTQPPRGERGRRYTQIETGAVAENVHLQAAALGLGCVLVAGFDDAALSTALRLPEGHEPTTMMAIGPRRD